MKLKNALLFLISAGVVTQSFATSISSSTQMEIQQLLHNGENRQALQNSSRLIQTELETQRLRSLQRKEKATSEASLPTITPSTQCIAISGIYLKGITLLTTKDLERLTALPKDCITTANINLLVREITQLYINKGYITARVRFIAPDSSGKLGIQIVEGFIEDIQGGNPQTNINMLFPNLVGKPLNLKELEQGIDQANRLASNNLTMKLLPGKKFGGTIIQLNNQASSIWHPSISLDNTGQKSTGREILRANLGVDSPLGLSDYFNLNLSTTLANPKQRYNRAYSALYTLPYGRWSWSLFGTQSQYFNHQKLTISEIDVSGNSSQLGSSLDYVLHRDQRQINTVSTQLTYKQTNNYINDARIEVSSQKLTIAKLSYNHFRILSSGIFNATFGIDRGLPLFGAETAGDAINYQFTKFYTNLYWLNFFNLWQQPYKLKAIFVAQYSKDNLPGVEWIGITDSSAVGDFRLNSLSSKNGWYATTELSKDFYYRNLLLSPYIRLGYGQVFQEKMPNSSKRENDALGITLGQTIQFNKLKLDLGVSKGWILHSSFKQQEEINVLFKLSYKF
ncbi:hemolysin activation protein [Mergibacter septicus]|uniref:ShlB/FhaC/HecB family hemolysin secretion/activation protein n=1 Tax=Mergibacter septicus TaxID=221402 RepID=UPI001C766621|nr:ShlB/FhaC/HecB family hemolysin secretion/activation protein [Mergibacter septicus]QDJ13207.1 hemolysin activation protein [Mergibacter septicus]